jgi:hypothetical protein
VRVCIWLLLLLSSMKSRSPTFAGNKSP